MKASESYEQHKPEDMLLRVMRVAEILAKGQEDFPVNPPLSEQLYDVTPSSVGGRRAQKTQV